MYGQVLQKAPELCAMEGVDTYWVSNSIVTLQHDRDGACVALFYRNLNGKSPAQFCNSFRFLLVVWLFRESGIIDTYHQILSKSHFLYRSTIVRIKLSSRYILSYND